MSVIIKGEPTTIEAYMIDNMKISQPNHIKIARFAFNCETIEDADGTIYRKERKGEWINDGEKRICPFCKDFIVTGRSIVKYCWNCGAQLKERSEDA